MLFRKLVLFLIIPLITSTTAYAQDSNNTERKPTKYLLLGMTANSYRGDLMNRFSKYGAAFHLGIRFNKSKKINGEFEFMSGFITGQNSDYNYNADANATPNQFFFTNYTNLNYHLNIRLYERTNWKFFISQGIGLFRFTVFDENYENLNDQLASRELGEDFSNMTFNFPTQLGGMFTFDKGYGIMARLGWVNSRSDYIDNISSWGNSKKKDNIFTFKISFIVPLSYKPPSNKS